MRSILFCFIIISIAFSSASFAEEKKNLFKQFLPKSIQKNAFSSEQISSKIETYSRLNPELIFYILKNTEYRFEKKVHESENNFGDILHSKINENAILRNAWYYEQKEMISSELPLFREIVRINLIYQNEYLITYDLDKDFEKKEIQIDILYFLVCKKI